MKKIISVLLGMMVFTSSLYGCSKSSSDRKNTEEDNKITVISTIFAPYDFAKNIAGENAVVSMLIPPGSESHSYEPTPRDIINIQNSDVFVYVGGDSDSWVNDILNSMDTRRIRIITLMDCVEVVQEEIIDGMQNDEHEHLHDDEGDDHENEDKDDHDDHNHDEDDDTEYDEHVWTSPKNAKLIVQKLSDAICETDKTNADLYKKNTADYLAELDNLDKKFTESVSNSVRNTIIFGDRFPFRYLADAYGLDYYAAFPGCSTDTEANPATVAFLIDKIKSENIPVVFHIELSNKKMANTISEETGAKVLEFHSCHNVTKNEIENQVSYLDLMNQNLFNLEEAIG